MGDTSADSLGVLVVDGEPAFRERVRERLEASPPVSVTTAADVESATGNGDGTTIDAAVCSDTAADGSPADLVRRIAEAYDDPPVVLLVEAADDDAISAAIEAGADDCFPRTAAPEQCDLVVDRLADLVPGGDVRPGGTTGSPPREIVEHVDEVVVLATADLSDVRYVNPAYEELYGGSVDELYEDPWSFLAGVHPDDRDAYEADMERMLADFECDDPDDVYEGTYRLGTGDGTRWVDITRYPVVENGAVERFVAVIGDVTEREELERTYRDVFENVSDGLVVHDPETGGILDVNGRFCEMNGYDRDRLVGADIGLVTAGEEYSYEAAADLIDRAREEGPQLFEWRNERRDGETFPVEVHLAVVHIRGEECVLASVRDITERKRREREYEQVFHGVNDVISIHDPEAGTMVDANETLCELTGYDRETLLEIGVEGISPPIEGHDAERSYDVIRRVAETGEPEVIDGVIETEDGDRVPIEANVTPAVIGGEERVLSLGRDVTERRERERELREAQERFELVTDHVDEVIFITRGVLSFDPYEEPPEDRAVEYLSPAFERIFGKPVEAVYDDAAAYQDPIHPDDVGDLRDMLRRIAADEEAGEPRESYETEVRVEHPDRGTRWVHITTHPAPTEEGDAYRLVGIMEDVTDRKRRERTIRQLHDATERIQDAETPADVAGMAIEAARDVLGLPTAACWFHREDDAGPRLEPVSGTTPEGTFEPDAFEPGDIEYEAFDEGAPLVYDPSEHSPEYSLNAAIMLPLGERGVLGVGRRGAVEYEEFTIDAARTLAGHVRTALDRVTRARELRESERRFRQIAERIDKIVYLTNEDLTDLLYVNPAYEEIFGCPVEDLYEDPRSFAEWIHPEDEAGYRDDFEAMLADVTAGDPRDSYRFEFRIVRPDGGVRWLDAMGYPVLDDDGEPYRFVGLTDDVTEEKEREQRLETFHEATRTLTEAESRREASRIAVDAAEDVLNLPYVSVHLYDEAEGELRPYAATAALADDPESLPSFPSGDDLAWQTFVDGEAVQLSAVEGTAAVYGAGVPDPDLVLPLGHHGVMLVGAADGSFAAERVELAQILAATVQAALNHVEGERELQRREEELRRQQERAARLDRLNTVIRDIEQATVEKSTREAIEAAVCDRLTDVDPYRAAWIGAAEAGDGSIAVRASAGETGYAGRLDPHADEELGTHPAIEAIENGETRVCRGIARETPHAEWQKRALREGHQAMIAVPLGGGGPIRGVLTVAADSATAFDEEERSVIEELGRSIGYELGVIERQRALESDTTTELEFRVSDDGLGFVELSERGACRVELERSVRRSEGVFSAFYTVEGAPPEELATAAEGFADVMDATVVSRDGAAGLIEVRSGSWFGTSFTDHGGVIRTALATEGEGRLAVEIPGRVDTREVVESFRDRYPAVELLVKRDRERAVTTVLELQDVLEEQLTARQLEALETAYSAGYFEWPRVSSGEEIAGLLGITQPTFNKHLRTAERKTFTLLLDRERPADG